jgi:glycerol-3-phosphate dehydrogenase (NAD(P)+)
VTVAETQAKTITILGAGAMGSALATPLRARGHRVRLWGTWLDDEILDSLEAGASHPRTAEPLATGTELFRSDRLDEALDGADLAFLAVASDGVDAVTRLGARQLSEIGTLAITSKGFLRDPHGVVQLLPSAIRTIFEAMGLTAPAVVAVGGPCKANEVAAGRPTATIYGCQDLTVAEAVAAVAQTPNYRIEPTSDDIGLEVSAALKNVFAIGLGFADGLAEVTATPWHNLKSAIFAQAVREMSIIAGELGGEPRTVYGLAGTGDLEVTGLSGRNKVYGARIGAGTPAGEALTAMIADHQTVEGVPAASLAVVLASQLFDDPSRRLPLLHAVHAIIRGAEAPFELLARAALPQTVTVNPAVAPSDV